MRFYKPIFRPTKLWDEYKDKNFVVIGVPSNSFNQKTMKKRLKNSEVNFNISFPMTSIYQVKGDNAHEIYKWAKRKSWKISNT